MWAEQRVGGEGQGHFHFVRAFLPAESHDSQDVVEVREDDEVSTCKWWHFRVFFFFPLLDLKLYNFKPL